MTTVPIKSQIHQIRNGFWSGGISNPSEIIEQIMYLLVLKRLDDLHTLEESKAATLKQLMELRVFPKDKDKIGKDGRRPYDDLRWCKFKSFASARKAPLRLGFPIDVVEAVSAYGNSLNS